MALSQEQRDKIVDALRRKLRSRDTTIRRTAATYLSYLKDCQEEAIDIYIESAIEAPNAADREAAKNALIRIGEPALEAVYDNFLDADDEYPQQVGMEIVTKILMRDDAQKQQEEKGEDESEDRCCGCSHN